MNNLCVLCDFDGTVTKSDGLYSFIEANASNDWKEIEQAWIEGRINSQKCLVEEFKLIFNLSEELIANFIKTVKIDEYFEDFYNETVKNNIDFYIVSDGIDYFINETLKKFDIKNIKIISNHAEFKNGKFEITFPNKYTKCKHDAGTCKCKVLSDLKDKYDKIIYIGDGISDFCVSSKTDILFAKSKLAIYCKDNNIKYIPFENFEDIRKDFENYCS